MKTYRGWHVLALLGLIIDLVNPTLPGVFSLLNCDFFMDGATRAQGNVPNATCLRGGPRVRTSAEPSDHTAARASHVVVRDARRIHRHPEPRRPLYVTTVRSSADTEDH